VCQRMIVTLVLLLAGAVSAQAQDQPHAPPESQREARTLNLSAYAELLRSDVRAQKVAILTEVMGFTEAEDKAFWPIYRDYDREMTALGDQRVAMIAEYARTYSNLTEAAAETLASKALDLEARRHAAKAKCYDRLKMALSPRTALRFLQVEHQLLLLIDLQISAALPIASQRQLTEASPR
jgi:hypothetical protein